MIKRSITIKGHRTSISLEAPFWDCLHTIAQERGQSLSAVVAAIDLERTKQLTNNAYRNTSGLSGTIRVYVLNWALTRR